MTHDNHSGAEHLDEAPLEQRIDISRHWQTLWRCRYFIVGLSVVMAGAVGAFVYCGPRTYSTTYVYSSWGQLDAHNQQILFHTFFSAENMERIIGALRKRGQNECADRIAEASKQGQKAIADIIALEVWPVHTDVSKRTALDPVEAEELRKLQADFFTVTLQTRSTDSLAHLTPVVRDNLEQEVPTVFLEWAFRDDLRKYRSQVAGLMAERFELQLSLKTSKAIIARLREIETATALPGKQAAPGTVLQFNVGGDEATLPVEYQVELREADVAKQLSDIEAKQAKLSHDQMLIALVEELLGELTRPDASLRNLQGFLSYLEPKANSCQDEYARDYLESLTQELTNRLSAGRPLVDKPETRVLPRGTVWNTLAAFLAGLVLTSVISLIYGAAHRAGRRR